MILVWTTVLKWGCSVDSDAVECLKKRALSVHSWFTVRFQYLYHIMQYESAVQSSELAVNKHVQWRCAWELGSCYFIWALFVINDLWMFGITFQPFWNYLEICVAALRGLIDFFGKSCISKFFVQIFCTIICIWWQSNFLFELLFLSALLDVECVYIFPRRIARLVWKARKQILRKKLWKKLLAWWFLNVAIRASSILVGLYWCIFDTWMSALMHNDLANSSILMIFSCINAWSCISSILTILSCINAS